MNTTPIPLPFATRKPEHAPGHWLLARVGKRVLRPGGLALTRRMLDAADVPGADIVELAPGLGRTAADILAAKPRSYIGIEKDADAARHTAHIVGARGRIDTADATATGLPRASADLVIGEAMLTMQSDRGKRAIIAEAARLLRPGGRYAIHELGLHPDDLDPERKASIHHRLAQTIKVNARPLTIAEWSTLLTDAGLIVTWTDDAPMALLQLRRNIADEGIRGTLRIARNVLRDRAIRARVLAMRRVFVDNADTLRGVALIAHKPTTA